VYDFCTVLVSSEKQSSPPDTEVALYSDGACAGNPGPGGWAFILHHLPSGKVLEISGAVPQTTNNQMELQAAIEGLQYLKRPSAVRLVTDSTYLKQGITEWIHNWKRRGWKRKTRNGLKPVKNVEQWMELDQLVLKHEVVFELVKGHSGHPENERCDELAVQAYKDLLSKDAK